MRRARQKGFTLVELMVAVAIIGVLASVAVPAFIRYIYKSQASEAGQMLKRIYDGARSYYMDPNFGSAQSITPLNPQFPVTASGGLYVADTECCAHGSGGRAPQCRPQAVLWQTEEWIAVAFSITGPHRFAYAYHSEQGAPGARDGTHNYTALARADFNCDGVFSDYAMFGTADETYSGGPSGTSKLRKVRPLE